MQKRNNNNKNLVIVRSKLAEYLLLTRTGVYYGCNLHQARLEKKAARRTKGSRGGGGERVARVLQARSKATSTSDGVNEEDVETAAQESVSEAQVERLKESVEEALGPSKSRTARSSSSGSDVFVTPRGSVTPKIIPAEKTLDGLAWESAENEDAPNDQTASLWCEESACRSGGEDRGHEITSKQVPSLAEKVGAKDPPKSHSSEEDTSTAHVSSPSWALHRQYLGHRIGDATVLEEVAPQQNLEETEEEPGSIGTVVVESEGPELPEVIKKSVAIPRGGTWILRTVSKITKQGEAILVRALYIHKAN